MNRKTGASLLLALAVAAIIWWMTAGMHLWTSTQHMVEVKDELFGTVNQEWVREFQPGLELLGTIAAVFVASALGLLWLDRRSRLKN